MSYLAAIDEVDLQCIKLIIPICFNFKTLISIPNKNPLAVLEDEALESELKLSRMESEMMEVFNRKLEMKKKKLEDLEKTLSKDIEVTKSEIDQMKKDIELKREAFLEEKSANPDILESPTHSNTSSASVLSSSSSKRLLRFSLFDAIKIK